MQLFEYRQKWVVNLGVLFLFALIALGPFSFVLGSMAVWNGCVATQGVIILWFMSRRLVVDDRGIHVVILWRLPLRFVAWEAVEEANVYAVLPRRRSAWIARAATRQAGPTVDETTIKLIVESAEPLYIHLGALKQGAAAAELVLSRVRHVART